jgi:hypothetical protein
MMTRAFSLCSYLKRLGGIFLLITLVLSLLYTPGVGLVGRAEAAEQTCDVTTTFNIVSPGTTITISWQTSGYSQATLNGEAVSVGNGSKTFTVAADTTYKLEANNGRSGSKCTVSTTVFCRQPAPPLTPVDPKPPVDPRDPNPPNPPVAPKPPVDPGPRPPADPEPAARANIILWTDGFLTPLTSGSRTIAKDANISRLEWQSVNAIRCEGRGFVTGGAVTGQITNGQAIALNQGQTKDYALRCQNSVRVWSSWEEVRIIKEANTPPQANRPPAAPIISGADESTAASASGLVNQTLPFTFKATDPDGDRLIYRIDWDTNGTVDTVLPATGSIPNGTAQTHNNVWTAPGTYEFRAQTVDERGAVSGWTSHTIRIDNVSVGNVRPLPPQVILQTDQSLVRTDQSTAVRLRVLADYKVSCTVYGVAGGTDTFTHPGSAREEVYSYQTDPLFAMQLIRAVCVPQIPNVAMATEIRERRVGVVSSIQEQ